MSRIGPVVIDDESGAEIENTHDRSLVLLEGEVLAFDKLIKETSRRHDVQRGGRMTAESVMALKHSFEEMAEQKEMNRLNGLRAKSISRLNSHPRRSIVGSRMPPSRLASPSAVPIKGEHSKVQKRSVSVGSSRSSSTRPPVSSILASSATRSTSLNSPSDKSRAVSAPGNNRRMTRGSSRKVKKEETEAEAGDYNFVYDQESDDEDYVDTSRVNRLMDPAHTTWNLADSDKCSMKEMKHSETSEDSDSYEADVRVVQPL
jgi:hypothetical protein